METNEKYFENNFGDYYHLKLLDLSDGKLRTEDGNCFQIHKFMLARSSKYFYALFCNMGKDKEDILIPGIKGKDLSNILSYLYTGIIHMTEENICDLIEASDYLLLDDLLLQLKQSLRFNLTLANSLSIFKMAAKINRGDISRESFRFIQTRFESVVRCKDSQISELPLDLFKLLLTDKNLCVRSEMTVWLSIIGWVEADPPNRLPWVSDLLMHLSVSDIDENLAKEILQHDIVAKNPYCQEIVDKSRTFDGDAIQTLWYFLHVRTGSFLALFAHRQPTKLNLIAHYNSHNGTEYVQLYLTYDENMDLWRKVAEIDMTPEILLTLNDRIYMFRTSENRNLYYNVIEKRWNEVREFEIERYNYDVVELNGLIYVLGGYSEATGEETYDVEIYDTATDEWRTTMPMGQITSFATVTHNNLIYVMGYRLSVFGVDRVVQAYDPSTETWSMRSLPSLNRFNYALVVYQDMIYAIGGSDDARNLTEVEIFDPVKNEWSFGVDLPYGYYIPRAIILNDTLVVYDNHLEDRNYLKTNPPVQWNAYQNCWEPLKEPFMNNLHMYYFLTIENSASVNNISRENKDPEMHFERSHFV